MSNLVRVIEANQRYEQATALCVHSVAKLCSGALPRRWMLTNLDKWVSEWLLMGRSDQVTHPPPPPPPPPPSHPQTPIL